MGITAEWSKMVRKEHCVIEWRHVDHCPFEKRILRLLYLPRTNRRRFLVMSLVERDILEKQNPVYRVLL